MRIWKVRERKARTYIRRDRERSSPAVGRLLVLPVACTAHNDREMYVISYVLG
jgi:hypothetical protein